MVLLFRDFYEKQYKVPLCSCIAIVWLIFFVLVLVLPWIVAHSAGGKYPLNHFCLDMTALYRFLLYFRLLDQGTNLL